MDAFLDLPTFIDALRRQKQLVEIDAEVDPCLEVAEIHRRVIQEGGSAILFNNPKGSEFPLVTNLFGTKQRVDLAFGKRAEALLREASSLPHEMIPPSFAKLWRKRSLIAQLFRVGLRFGSKAAVAEVVERDVNLDQLPIITSWKEDGGPFVTLPLVYTEHPENGVHNLGMYRMQQYDRVSTGMHFQIGKGGGFHLAAADRPLPVNVFIGGPPTAILAAVAPLPENVPELLLGSLALGQRFPMAHHPESRLPLLRDAEFVFVGTVDPQERKPEGPFGDHYGYYSLIHDFPVFRCQKIFRKRNPIYPATVVGKPRQEDFYIGDYLQETLSPLFPLVMPSVRDIWSYGETGFHSLASAVVHERYRREAMMSAFRILGEGQLSLTKFLIAIDRPLDLRKFSEVLVYALERSDFRRDLFILSHLALDTLDYTGPKLNEGSRGILLGIGEPIRTLLREFRAEFPRFLNKLKVFCPGCLLVEGDSHRENPELAEQVAGEPRFSDWPLIVLCDDVERSGKSEAQFLWNTFTRFEPAGDIYSKGVSLERYHPSLEPPIVIDARMKSSYPDELECDPETRRLVDSRWKEYGF